MEVVLTIVGLCILLVPIGATVGLRVWGKRVAARQGGTPGWRAAAWAPVAALVIAGSGTAVTLFRLVNTFHELGNLPADEKQAALSRGIEVAMGASSITGPVGSLLFFGSLVLFGVGSNLPDAKRGPP
jgi:hypothetical protein